MTRLENRILDAIIAFNPEMPLNLALDLLDNEISRPRNEIANRHEYNYGISFDGISFIYSKHCY